MRLFYGLSLPDFVLQETAGLIRIIDRRLLVF